MEPGSRWIWLGAGCGNHGKGMLRACGGARGEIIRADGSRRHAGPSLTRTCAADGSDANGP